MVVQHQAGLFMTFGDSCVEHFDEYTVTSSIGRVDVTELSLSPIQI